MVFFSIIMPVYNSKNIIQKSLQSLEEQTYKNFEVIFVDDCSTDGSYEYLQNYRENSPLNIIVCKNNRNVGPGMSRNKGISIAKGNYITFIDSDDWYETNLLEVLKNELEIRRSDVILFDYNRCYPSGKKTWIKCTRHLNDNTNINSYIALAFESLWSCVFSTSLIKNNPIPGLYNSEDAAAIPLLLSSANVISHINVPLYNYLYRKNSLSTSQNIKIYKGFIDANLFIEKNISDKYNEEKEFRGINLVLYGAVYKGIEAQVPYNDIKDIITEFEMKHPKCYSNKYLIYYPLRKRCFLFLVKKRLLPLISLYCKLQRIILGLLSR